MEGGNHFAYEGSRLREKHGANTGVVRACGRGVRGPGSGIRGHGVRRGHGPSVGFLPGRPGHENHGDRKGFHACQADEPVSWRSCPEYTRADKHVSLAGTASEAHRDATAGEHSGGDSDRTCPFNPPPQLPPFSATQLQRHPPPRSLLLTSLLTSPPDIPQDGPTPLLPGAPRLPASLPPAWSLNTGGAARLLPVWPSRITAGLAIYKLTLPKETLMSLLVANCPLTLSTCTDRRNLKFSLCKTEFWVLSPKPPFSFPPPPQAAHLGNGTTIHLSLQTNSWLSSLVPCPFPLNIQSFARSFRLRDLPYPPPPGQTPSPLTWVVTTHTASWSSCPPPPARSETRCALQDRSHPTALCVHPIA